MTVNIRRCLLLPLFLLPILSNAQSFSLLTYNCENAFDTIDTPRYADEEYLPGGRLHWTRSRFRRKMHRIAQVVMAADTGKPLDIAVLQEVESDSVMEHLVGRTPLRSFGYRYVTGHSDDSRGVRVAILYSPLTFHLLGSQSFGLDSLWLRSHRFTPTRDILHVWGSIPTFDTLDVFGLHLPSKLGGAEAVSKRRTLLRLLAHHIDSVRAVRQTPLIVVAGDFNDRPRSAVAGMRNLMQHRRLGSYKFRGIWNWIDQIWVSKELDRRCGGAYDCVEAMRLPALLEDDEAYGGKKPFRTYYGPRYHDGYSDHLPVTLKLEFGK